MSVAEPGVISMWALMVSWYTPAVLFCFLNLMIGTIFIASNFKSLNNRDLQNQQQQGDEENLPQLLRRVPSLLRERVNSFNFSLYRSESPPKPLLQPDDTQLITDPLANQTQQRNNSDHDSDHHVIRTMSDTSGSAPAKIPAKIPVKLKRWASEKSVFLGFDEEEEEVERRRPATARESQEKGIVTVPFGEDEGVDAKADDFISKFRQQLKLQRLDSLLKYGDMLKRGY